MLVVSQLFPLHSSRNSTRIDLAAPEGLHLIFKKYIIPTIRTPSHQSRIDQFPSFVLCSRCNVFLHMRYLVHPLLAYIIVLHVQEATLFAYRSQPSL